MLDESNATPYGLYNCALVAGPLSPLLPVVPVPAIVVMIPLDTVIYTYIIEYITVRNTRIYKYYSSRQRASH